MKAGIHICAWIVSHFMLLISEFFLKKHLLNYSLLYLKKYVSHKHLQNSLVFSEFKAGKKIHWSMVKPG